MVINTLVCLTWSIKKKAGSTAHVTCRRVTCSTAGSRCYIYLCRSAVFSVLRPATIRLPRVLWPGYYCSTDYVIANSTSTCRPSRYPQLQQQEDIHLQQSMPTLCSLPVKGLQRVSDPGTRRRDASQSPSAECRMFDYLCSAIPHSGISPHPRPMVGWHAVTRDCLASHMLFPVSVKSCGVTIDASSRFNYLSSFINFHLFFRRQDVA